MKKLPLIWLFIFANAYEVSLHKGWNLVGALGDVKLSNLPLDNKDVIYTYKNKIWYCYSKINLNCEKLKKLSAGDGFWIFTDKNKILNLPQTNFSLNLNKGWNLVAVGNNKFFNNYDYTLIWQYSNNTWKYYTPFNIDISNFSKIDQLKKTEGIWLFFNKDGYLEIGDEKYPLINGEFYAIKNSSLDVEKIWNLGFKIKKENITFDLAIKIVKENTKAQGSVVLKNITINNDKLTPPIKAIIHGKKSNGDEAEKTETKASLLKDIVTLKGDMLYLNFGTLLKNQNLISQSSLKQKTTYDISITSDKLKFKNYKIISLENLNWTSASNFINKEGIEGRIKIK